MPDLPAALRPLRDRPGTAALFLDFDGTLSPVVPDPGAARPLPGVPDALAELGHRLALVAVVSGRPASFLVEVLGAETLSSRVRLVGLYGLEEVLPDGSLQVVPAAAPWRSVVTAVTERARAEAPHGVMVEPKGLTVTLHWRGRPNAEAWAMAFAAEHGQSSGLAAQPGRMSIELRPPVRVDKGTVVSSMARGHHSVGYFGDDLGDLPAFEALARLASEGVAVARVAVTDRESPPQVAAAADVVVNGPRGALELLHLLASGVPGPGVPGPGVPGPGVPGPGVPGPSVPGPNVPGPGTSVPGG